jgi:hypothetical protein
VNRLILSTTMTVDAVISVSEWFTTYEGLAAY